MHYPTPTQQQIEQYERDGFLIVENAVPEADLERLRELANELIRRRLELAYDWDWRSGEARDARAFRIVQCAAGDLKYTSGEAIYVHKGV